jgi:hypothetical protein
MREKPENPSASPHQHRASDSKIIEQYSDYGLTMRDYFAAACLMGLSADSKVDGPVEAIAGQAYKMADAMLEARQS